MEFTGGLAPALTLNPCSIRVNYGPASAFARPMPEGHRSVHDWLESHDPRKRKASSDDSDDAGHSLGFAMERTVSLSTVAMLSLEHVGLFASSGAAHILYQSDTNTVSASVTLFIILRIFF